MNLADVNSEHKTDGISVIRKNDSICWLM